MSEVKMTEHAVRCRKTGREVDIGLDGGSCACTSVDVCFLSLCEASPPAAPSGWQPIETAPRDFSLILVFVPGTWELPAEQFIAFWKCDGWRMQLDNKLHVEPTHWQPLPAPPEA